MKKIIFGVFLTLFFSLEYFSQNLGKLEYLPEFRGYKWGERFLDVKAKEVAPYLQTTFGFGQQILSYKGRIAGHKARIDYVFKDKQLVEGIYEIKVDSFETSFEKIKQYYIDKLDHPIYWAGAHPLTKINWVGNKNGLCRGPEIYWEYFDGFVAIICEKYKEEITISILYVYDKTIADYGKYVTFPYKVISEN